MDEPREWHYASLGYGPEDRISETVRETLDAIIQEYATFVRKASAKVLSLDLPFINVLGLYGPASAPNTGCCSLFPF